MLRVMTEIEIRGVPEDVYRRLRAHAAKAGTTLSDYRLSQLMLLAEDPPAEDDGPTTKELVARVRGREL
jgi:plasmid stability protein